MLTYTRSNRDHWKVALSGAIKFEHNGRSLRGESLMDAWINGVLFHGDSRSSDAFASLMRNETLWMRSWRTVSLSDAPTTTADRRLLVTLDSSALKSWRSVIVPALRPYRYGVGITSVTMRESARQVELSLGEDLWRILTEVTVWGESRWGEAVWGETPADVRATVLRETGVLDESPVMVLGDDRDALRWRPGLGEKEQVVAGLIEALTESSAPDQRAQAGHQARPHHGPAPIFARCVLE